MEFVVSLFFYAYKEKRIASHNTKAVGKIVFAFEQNCYQLLVSMYLVAKVTKFRQHGKCIAKHRWELKTQQSQYATCLKRFFDRASVLGQFRIIFLCRAVFWLSNDVQMKAFARKTASGKAFKHGSCLTT